MSGKLPLVAAFLRRDWAIARSYRFAFVLQVVDALLYLTLFFFLGRLVDPAAFAAETDVDNGYFAFVIIGLALMEIMEVGLTSFAQKLRRDQTTGTLEALIVTPASHSFVIIGSAAYDLLRATMLSVILLLLGVTVFGLRLSLDVSSALIIAVALPATLAMFAAVGVAIAAATMVVKETTALLALTTTLITLFGGVFYPISVLPAGLQEIAEASPFTWALDVWRAAFLGGPVPLDELGGLVVVSLIAVPVSLTVFRAGLTHAKRAGTVAQY